MGKTNAHSLLLLHGGTEHGASMDHWVQGATQAVMCRTHWLLIQNLQLCSIDFFFYHIHTVFILFLSQPIWTIFGHWDNWNPIYYKFYPYTLKVTHITITITGFTNCWNEKSEAGFNVSNSSSRCRHNLGTVTVDLRLSQWIREACASISLGCLCKG